MKEKIMSKVVKALIHVRAGSQRVKNKNIRPFAGSNLLEIKIKQLLRIKELDGVVVNTESDEMLDIARALGAECIKRDDYYASSTVPMNEVHRNMAENMNCDIVLCAPVTAPLIKDATISKMIACYFADDKKYDSLNTAHLVKEFLWKDNLPLNYDPAKLPKSQDLPDIMALNFAVNIISKDKYLECRNVIGRYPNIVAIDKEEAIDIDDEVDFDFAEYMYKKLRMK